MAIDPSISLGIRPPVIPVPDIQTPLERFAKVLSLRNLMTQGQMGQIGLQSKQLELQQLQREIEQQDRINKLLAGTSSAAAAPLQTAPIAQPVTPPAAPEPAPYTPVAPYTPAAGAQLGSLMTSQAPDVTPTAAPPVPGRAPSAAAISIPDPYAGLPSDAELIRQGGTNGFTIVKNLNAGREAFYKQQQEKIKLHQSALTGMASLAAGAHDEPSKVEAIAAAFRNGWIDGPTRDQLMSHPYNKKEWDDFAVNSLEGDKRLEELRKQVNQTALEKKQQHDQAMYPSEEAKAVADATKAGQEASGTQPITPQQAITNQQTANQTDLADLEIGGKPHKVLVNKRTGEVVKDLGESGIKPPQVNVNASASLLDRESARFVKPHEKAVADANSQLEKINEARTLINGPATAQAIGIPKVLTALAGGAGSGLRMTKAELDSIAKARGIQGDVEGFINKVSGKGVLTPEQQRQLTGLLDDVAGRMVQKQSIANEAIDGINSAGTREEIVNIDKAARHKLGESVRAQNEPTVSLGPVKVSAPNPDGTTTTITFPDLKSATAFKQKHGIK